ncbi:MAG: hypothetical protein L0Z70_07640 [Chloroflexi bacterium]|nr:hypothetical protein [Chloroflexota bacterium]
MAGLNLWRSVQAARQWQFLASFAPWLPPYLFFASALWLAAWSASAWASWRLLSWAPGFARLLILAYAAHYWLDRLFLQSRGASSNLAFAALASLFYVGGLLYLLSHRRFTALFAKR